jgi:pimeloyl-ACP methyl ester carboxylesterase
MPLLPLISRLAPGRVALLAWLTLTTPAAAQLAPQAPLSDSRRADLGGLVVEYFEFGTPSGPPVIFLQDFHDYFRLEEAPGWREYLARFGDRYRVLAPVRRGYGASDELHWGFDVPTLGEDILRFLDATGIRQAVFVGRVPATQEMTWLAEHHPDRLAGLVYIERPAVFEDMRDPEVRAWSEAFWRGACDLGDRAVAITGPRTSWQPHFLADTTRRIEVPAALLTIPAFAGSMHIRFLGMLPRMAGEPSCAPGVQEYYSALAADSARVARLRAGLVASDRSAEIAAAMDRAFGSRLVRSELSFTPGSGSQWNTFYPPMRLFLDGLAARQAWQ